MNALALKALVALVAVLAIAFGSYRFGVHVEHNANEADKAEAQQAALELHRAKSIAGVTVERETVQRSAKTEAVFADIQQGVVTYAQTHAADTDCRLDDSGLRLWSAANEGTGTAGVADGHADLPGGTPGAVEQRDDGSLEQSHRRGQGLSPVQGSAQRLGQMAGEGQ